MEGWIKLHRCFLDWEWIKKPEMITIFIYLLLRVNHDKKTWQGIEINRGQLVTGLISINSDLKIPIQKIRTCLKKLQISNEIIVKSTNKYSIITICNYDKYQCENNESNKQLTNNQQTTNKQLTTNNNDNNDKNIKKECDKSPQTIEIRINKFKTDLNEYIKNSQNGIKEFWTSNNYYELKNFVAYWTQKNKNGKKLNFEMQKIFDISYRLSTWRKKVNNNFMKQPDQIDQSKLTENQKLILKFTK